MDFRDVFTLSNGCKMPCVGYGTWAIAEGEEVINSVKMALSKGYRHIDTAARYGNEVGVGQGIKESGLQREEIFVTSKVWTTDRGYEKTMKAFEKTMEDLGLEYLDLYLIHWPASESRFEDWEEINLSTWKALIDLYKAGKVKAIGVANFKPHHLKILMDTEVVPMVNQIEYHPGWNQEETIEYCNVHGIQVEAWSPLGRGRVLGDSTLIEIAEKYNKSTAQICLRWCLQNNIVPLPKSVTESRLDENLDIFDFEISKEDMKRIQDLPEFGGSGQDPDTVEF